MTEEARIQKSLVEQILEETLARIETREEFDSLAISQLKHLVGSGAFTRAKEIAAAI